MDRGVDMHQRTHVLVAPDEQGHQPGTRMAPNSAEGWAMSLDRAREQQQIGCRGVENSGSLGTGVARFLHAPGEAAVREVRPQRTARYRRRSHTQDKTDQADALAIARLLLAEGASLLYVPRDDVSTALHLLINQLPSQMGIHRHGGTVARALLPCGQGQAAARPATFLLWYASGPVGWVSERGWTMARERVAVLHCPATASDGAVRDAVFRAAELVGDAVQGGLSGKRRILIKANMGTGDLRTHLGWQVALSDVGVMRATVALIRQFHRGELLIGDATTGDSAYRLWDALGYATALVPYDVRPVDLKDGPFVELAVPGGGLLHSHYWLAQPYADADAIVSCAKLKAHLSTGSTGSLKNLFGLLPTLQYGSPRRYLHAPIRLPRAIVDCGLLNPPVLCVIDGLVGQLDREWHGPPVRTDTLVLGTNTVATDATAMRVQGMDPTADYGTWPFYFDSNPLALAQRMGLGPVEAAGIDVVGDGLDRVRHPFTVDRERSEGRDLLRREVAQQALIFRDRHEEFLREYAGQIVALSEGQVIEAHPAMADFGARGDAGRPGAGHGIFLKGVVPAAAEREHLDLYTPIALGPAFTSA